MRELRVFPEAETELAEAAEWYESKRAGLGVELVAVIDRAFHEIQDAPLVCAQWVPDRPFRKKVLTRFPYVVFFRVDEHVVEVVAVAHAKRRPGYWLGRAPRP